MKPKDLLKDLESGDRTAVMLEEMPLQTQSGNTAVYISPYGHMDPTMTGAGQAGSYMVSPLNQMWSGSVSSGISGIVRTR